MSPQDEAQLRKRFVYDPENGKVFSRRTGIEKGFLTYNDYMGIYFKGKNLYLHRVAWFLVHGKWPHEIDHINKITTDNRLSNLREVTHAKNMHNMKLRVDNSSGTHGVSYIKSRKKWSATIRTNGKLRFLGRFNTMEEAIEARKKAEGEER